MDEFYSLFEKINKKKPKKVIPLPQSGSARKYYRFFFDDNNTLIGFFNQDIKENIAHYTFTGHFVSLNLPVPRILANDESFRYFILDDLGDDTLLKLKDKEGLSEIVKQYYKQAIADLLVFQIEGIKSLDLSKAYPSEKFDRRSIMWDLNYFKYFFLKTNEISFDEALLEDDFEKFSNELLKADSGYFMYRDFQARNIMVKNDKLWYIDFQGGRKGPLQYDVVSLLYQAKANLPDKFRTELLNYYLDILEKFIPGETERFLNYYPLFIYFRFMQVLGAYGYRGLFQRKGHFLQSIPFIIQSLKKTFEKYPFPQKYSELNIVFNQIISFKEYDFPAFDRAKLNITISSFSYKKSGIPVDITENGGGFVFDCRALPNPGRIAELKEYTGLDKPIIEYLKDKKELKIFLNNVFSLVDQSVDNYLERNFANLMVSFGCTGGQHRSVYSAEEMKKHLIEKYEDKVNIILKHKELNRDNKEW